MPFFPPGIWDAKNRIVLGNVSRLFGLSLFVLGHFSLLGVGLRLSIKWAGVVKFFGPTHSIPISSSFVAFSLHLILIPSPYVAFPYYFIYFLFYAKLYHSLLLLKINKKFSQTEISHLCLSLNVYLLQPKLLGSLGKTKPSLKSLHLSLSLLTSVSLYHR